jgi:hypothetical protein
MWLVILMITFLSLTKAYWTVYDLQTNINYTFNSEYHNLHTLVLTSSCCWYEFHTRTFWNIFFSTTQLHSLNEYLSKYLCLKEIWHQTCTCKCNLCINPSPLPYWLAIKKYGRPTKYHLLHLCLAMGLGLTAQKIN